MTVADSTLPEQGPMVMVWKAIAPDMRPSCAWGFLTAKSAHRQVKRGRALSIVMTPCALLRC